MHFFSFFALFFSHPIPPTTVSHFIKQKGLKRHRVLTGFYHQNLKNVIIFKGKMDKITNVNKSKNFLLKDSWSIKKRCYICINK